MIVNKQRSAGLTDRAAASKISELQAKEVIPQTFNVWRRGGVPNETNWIALAQWLEIPLEEFEKLADEARTAAGSSKLPLFSSFTYALQQGKIADRKEGKYRFEPHNMGRRLFPDGRYLMSIDTKVMEPIFRVGTQIWLDPAVSPTIGAEVVAHSGGFAWLGVLESLEGAGVVLSRPSGSVVSLKTVIAIHVVVLSSRVTD